MSKQITMERKNKKKKRTDLEKLDHGQLTIDDYKRTLKLQKKLIEIFKKQETIIH